MRLHGIQVVVQSKSSFTSGQSPFSGQTGEVITYRFDVHSNRVAFLIRFGAQMGMFYHDELTFMAEDVVRWDEELKRMSEIMGNP